MTLPSTSTHDEYLVLSGMLDIQRRFGARRQFISISRINRICVAKALVTVAYFVGGGSLARLRVPRIVGTRPKIAKSFEYAWSQICDPNERSVDDKTAISRSVLLSVGKNSRFIPLRKIPGCVTVWSSIYKDSGEPTFGSI